MSKTQQQMDQEAAADIAREYADHSPGLFWSWGGVINVGLKCIAYGRANPTPFDFKKAIESLDGVAAVNLAEPSSGDLQRVVNAYRADRAKLQKVREAIQENHQWHIDYDHEGYPGSHLEDINLKALALLDGKEK